MFTIRRTEEENSEIIRSGYGQERDLFKSGGDMIRRVDMSGRDKSCPKKN